MKFTLEVNMDNAAFEDLEELKRILRALTESYGLHDGIAGKQQVGVVHDVNGNTVGSWRFTSGRRPR